MSHSDAAVALLRAVLRKDCGTDLAARRYLTEAAQLGVDPLDYCAHRFGVGANRVWQRAAAWAGYPSADELPSRSQLPDQTIDRLDHLGGLRTLRRQVLGQDIVFLSPKFEQVLNLAHNRTNELASRLRFAPPAAIESGATRAASAQLLAHATERTRQIWPALTAADLTAGARRMFAAALVLLVILVCVAGSVARPALVPVLGLLLLAPGLMRLGAALRSERVSERDRRLLDDVDLPVYTVLIPLRDEAAMVPLLARAMSAIDYPPEKLDIKFVVESKSTDTIAAVQEHLDDPRFRLVVVPEAAPATKPKALDFALPLAAGKYLVVYDAEDVPDPDQLRLAASRFERDGELACLQAELVPENASENALTALFAGEYAGLFGRLLPALAKWGLPMPLGGTSNHFRLEVLRDIGGWDAHNVTEDADLGVRLARCGYRAEMLQSQTLEEAPLHLASWMKQRTRWMKGWMQTYLVHSRRPVELLRDLGWRGFIGFQLLIGGMLFGSLLHTAFAATVVWRLATEGSAGLVPRDIWDWCSVGILVAGYGGAIALTLTGLRRQKAKWLLLLCQLVLPLYWMLHSLAAMRAAYQLVRQPDHWEKTTHGITRLRRTGTEPAGRPVLRPRTG